MSKPIGPGDEFDEVAPGSIHNGKTEGVSPKAVAATLLPLAVGVVIMVLDLLGVIDVEDELWIGLLGASPVAGAAASQAKTGTILG